MDAFNRPGSLFYFFILGVGRHSVRWDYCSFAYSALACFRMGMFRAGVFPEGEGDSCDRR